jgi:hypothetical protein
MVATDMAKVDVRQLQASLQRAEEEIREKTDSFIYKINNRVNTIVLSGEDREAALLAATNYGDLANMKTSVQRAAKQRARSGATTQRTIDIDHDIVSNSALAIVEEVKELRATSPSSHKQLRFQELSPGQQVSLHTKPCRIPPHYDWTVFGPKYMLGGRYVYTVYTLVNSSASSAPCNLFALIRINCNSR